MHPLENLREIHGTNGDSNTEILTVYADLHAMNLKLHPYDPKTAEQSTQAALLEKFGPFALTVIPQEIRTRTAEILAGNLTKQLLKKPLAELTELEQLALIEYDLNFYNKLNEANVQIPERVRLHISNRRMLQSDSLDNK